MEKLRSFAKGEGSEKWQKRGIKMSVFYKHVSTSQNECNPYILHNCSKKAKKKKNEYLEEKKYWNLDHSDSDAKNTLWAIPQ